MKKLPFVFLRALTALCLVASLLAITACSTDGPGNGGADAADGTAADGGGGGSDAAVDTSGTGLPKLVINEVVAKAVASPGFNPTGSDWLELYNASDKKLDLKGYRLIDSAKKGFDLAQPLPAGTTIEAGGFLVVFFNDKGEGTPVIGKKLGADEAAQLFHVSGTLLDRVNWEKGDSPAGASWGRIPDGSAVLKTLAKATPGKPNQ